MREASLMCGERGCGRVAELMVESKQKPVEGSARIEAYCEEHARAVVKAAGLEWAVVERKPAGATRAAMRQATA